MWEPIRMYEKTITLFSEDAIDGKKVYRASIIDNVHLETAGASSMNNTGSDNSDGALLHIRHCGGVIETREGSKMYVAPNDFRNHPDNSYDEQIFPNYTNPVSGVVTVADGRDFFMEGAWTGDMIIYDEDYKDIVSGNGFFHCLNTTHTAYMVRSVTRHDLIPYFDIKGA